MKRGFTLIETLISIAILFTVISGAYSAVQTGTSGAVISREEVTAFYLAQESAEEIRNMRDVNGLQGNPWLTNISAAPTESCYFGSYCYYDAVTNVLSRCNGGTHNSCPVVKQDPTGGFYGYDNSWTDTPYKRSILLSQISANEITMTVTVSWQKGTNTRSFRIRENLFNWQ